MRRAAVTLRDFCAGYGDRTVLDHMTLAFSAGRTTGIIGPGGSGKSTLLKSICGHEQPDLWYSGCVQNLCAKPVYVPQFFPDGQATLAERLGDPQRVLRECWTNSKSLQEGLVRYAQTPLSQIPRALRRMAEVTIALTRDCDLVVLDEPDSDSEAEQVTALAEFIKARRGSRTLILATHNLGLVREVADEVAFVLDGQLIEAGDTQAVFDAPREQRTRDMITWGA